MSASVMNSVMGEKLRVTVTCAGNRRHSHVSVVNRQRDRLPRRRVFLGGFQLHMQTERSHEQERRQHHERAYDQRHAATSAFLS
jgi:hypothetical protein